MKKLAGILFLISWMLCGCAVESVFNDWRSCVGVVAGLIVCIASAVVLANWDK